MKKLFAVILACLTSADAALISHTDYTSGSVITAAGQNANENTIVNEINGNLDSANIEDGGLATADYGDASVTVAKLSTTIQSTMTWVNALSTYRRPNLARASNEAVDVEANTLTSNRTCVLFPNEIRCVTEDTSSTSQYRRFLITETAAVSGTHNSGMRPGETEASNTWYGMLAVKTTDDSTKFVLVGSTIVPSNVTQATALNAIFGVNNWAYLGLFRNGNLADSASAIVAMKQQGPFTTFISTTGVNFVSYGITLKDCAGASSCSWTRDTPGHIVSATIFVAQTPNAQGLVVQTVDNNTHIAVMDCADNSCRMSMPVYLDRGGIVLRSGDTNNESFELILQSYYDPLLVDNVMPLF